MKDAILSRFASTFSSRKTTVFQDIKDYLQWETDQGRNDFKPEASDDVAIRTYLLDNQVQGAALTTLKRIRSSLEYFYNWLKVNDLIAENPFEKFNLKWPALTQRHIRPRHDAFPGPPGESEIARLRALNRLAESTNRHRMYNPCSMGPW